jgi:hypothetical protein
MISINQRAYIKNTLNAAHLSLILYHSFIPLACAECDDSLLFSGASSVPSCYIFSINPIKEYRNAH